MHDAAYLLVLYCLSRLLPTENVTSTGKKATQRYRKITMGFSLQGCKTLRNGSPNLQNENYSQDTTKEVHYFRGRENNIGEGLKAIRAQVAK
ncbi:unnamed protein product [Dovyalis caffra]|uniref:Uncharacterized protein n=1 Tax=Dovyalis caffra TaxID=77055 RepID=A0AAV1RYK3_9ROSI|nr:unnamed protein product [Dovyalis caffra]